MGALLLARACHGDPLSNEIAAAARAQLTADSMPPAQGKNLRRARTKGGTR
jgi:hypothetical protein